MVPELDRQGQVCGVLSIGRDLTESKKAEEQTKLLEAQLRQAQKLEAVGTLAGGIAHDFNNILAAIMGYAELTQDDLPPGHPSQDSVEQILKGTRRARDLVRQILNFSRPGEEHQHPVRLALLVKEALKLLRPSIPSSIEIKQQIPEEEVYVLADQSQMHQVLMNLCTNAAQAMEEKGVLEVGLETVTLPGESPSLPANLAPGLYQVLWVSDDGQGMDARTMARVFDPFFTTKQPGAGTGMGLSVVHGIVQAHGGTVTVESHFGLGTTFRVYIPTIEKEPETSGADKEPMSTGGESIMLVDDEEALLDIGRQVLERLGYRVTTQASSQEALELFRRDPQAFDLVITDYTMPHLTGTALAQQMLALRPELPIILCTGYSSDHVTGRRALDQGIRSLAQKPLRPSEIASLIRQVLDEDRAQS